MLEQALAGQAPLTGQALTGQALTGQALTGQALAVQVLSSVVMLVPVLDLIKNQNEFRFT